MIKLQQSIRNVYLQAILEAYPETLKNFLFYVDQETIIDVNFDEDMSESDIEFELKKINEAFDIQAELLNKLCNLIGKEK